MLLLLTKLHLQYDFHLHSACTKQRKAKANIASNSVQIFLVFAAYLKNGQRSIWLAYWSQHSKASSRSTNKKKLSNCLKTCERLSFEVTGSSFQRRGSPKIHISIPSNCLMHHRCVKTFETIIYILFQTMSYNKLVLSHTFCYSSLKYLNLL